MLELFYITNDPKIAVIAQNAGVGRIFVDMEYIGKDMRQKNMNTVKNHHTVEDVKNIRKAIDKSKLLVRVNPIHAGSKQEINEVINAGADVIMLPMWKSMEEVKRFFDIVDHRVKTVLLLETAQAANILDSVLALNDVDEIHIGLNDLSISLGRKFMFELLTDGTVDVIADKLRRASVRFGIGGVGRVFQKDLLPAENIIAEHYRLGSSMAILSRSFCNSEKITDLKEIERIFTDGVDQNRQFESSIEGRDEEFFNKIHMETKKIIDKIVREKV